MGWPGQASEHDADHGEADECGDGGGVTFEIAAQPAVAADPSERPLDDPSLGQDFEASNVGSLHDLQLPRSGAPDHERHLLASIATISEDALDEWKQSPRTAQQMEGSITVLHIGRMNHDVQ